MPPRPRIVPQRVDQGSDLVMPLRGAAEQPLPRRFITRPVHPLMAIDRAEVAPLRREIRVIQDSRFEPLRADIVPRVAAVARSEEHTSELQSLMRISYAVFCLKKTNKQVRH